MRRMLRWLVLALCLCLTTGAVAEIELIPQMEQWDAALPMEVTLRADVKTHMPFDDARCEQLNALLKHISLRLNTSTADEETIGRVSLRVDDKEALWMLQRETESGAQLRLSWQPEQTYASQGSAIASLMGEETALSLYGLSGNEQQWLDDGAVLMNFIGDGLEEYKKQSTIKTTIKNMGTARKKIIYTVPKSKTEVFSKAVTDYCPEGEMKVFLKGLVFSGQQKLQLWLNADGAVIRAEYTGKCGANEDALRQVSLVWRMRRDDNLIRDDVTLKTPAVEGSDYNTLTLLRDLSVNENGVVALEGEFSYAVKAEKKKTTLSGECKLTSTPEGEAVKLSGSASLTQKLPGEDLSTGVTILPDVLVGSDSGTPVVSGTVEVQELQGENIVEDAVIHVQAGAGTYIDWADAGLAVDMDAMTQEQLTDMLEGMSGALVPRLVLLPAEDTLYLSADLPEDVWQRIVEAAQSVLPEEETP